MTIINKQRPGFYAILVYIAYAWFLLIGGSWFFMNLATSKHFNVQAFFTVLIFAIQVYYKNRLVNLIIGVIVLCLSIFMLLDVFSDFNLFAKDAVFEGYIKALLSISVISIILSGILIFSYMMLDKDVVG